MPFPLHHSVSCDGILMSGGVGLDNYPLQALPTPTSVICLLCDLKSLSPGGPHFPSL